MNFKLRAESLGNTEDEIRREMATALGRIGRTFEDLILQLRRLEPLAGDEADEETRNRYAEVLRDARLYYWYLIVQRESLGLRNHELVIREYAVPPSVLGRK